MVEYDAVIVGAGILGLATAYHIKSNQPNEKILVVDKFHAAGQGNTAKSASAFRCCFSSKTNLSLAKSSIDFYCYLQDKLNIDLGIKFIGYLWLLPEKSYKESIKILRSLEEENVGYREFESEDLAKRLEMRVDLGDDEEARLMKLENIHKGILIIRAGVFNADNLVKFYENEFLRLGGEIEYGVQVKRLISEACEPLNIPGEPYFWQESRVAGVETVNGGIIRAKKTILATGAWTPQLTDEVGIECFIKPRKRQVFPIPARTPALQRLLRVEGFNKYNCLPFTFLDRPRIYIRPFPEEGTFWLGIADEFPRPYKLEENPIAEKNFYEYGIHPVISKYFPQFKDQRPVSPFAGHYSVCLLDGHPVIFEEKDLIVVAGASGSGLQKADAIGRIAAALYRGEEYALLFGDRPFKVSDLSIKDRRTEPENLII